MVAKSQIISMRYPQRRISMDSPPSYSLSVTGPLSEIGSSGIGGSISSDSVRANYGTTELQESDMESKSLSQDSFDYSDGINGENFNTLKKGPWTDILSTAANKVVEQRKLEVGDVAIEPPPEFQDRPSPPDTPSSSSLELLNSDTPTILDSRPKVSRCIIEFAESLVETVIEEALAVSCKILWPEGSIKIKPIRNRPNTELSHSSCNRTYKTAMRFYASSDYLASSSGALAGPGYNGAVTITPFSTLNRPASRSSLSSSRLSSSHNSLNTAGLSNKADDSSFITSAMSHDVLTGPLISDMYNVPFDSDIYTLPIDVVRPFHQEISTLHAPQRPKRHKHHRKRHRNTSSTQSEFEFCSHLTRERHYCGGTKPRTISHVKSQKLLNEACCNDIGASAVTINGTCCNTGKRHSVPSTSTAIAAAAVAHHHQQQLHQPQQTHQRHSKTHMRNIGEPIHMTLHEVRQYLQTLYSSGGSGGGSGDGFQTEPKPKRDKCAKMSTGTCPPSIHMAAAPKLQNLNNNNKYNSTIDSSELNTSTLSNNSSSNGLHQHQYNNNNVNNFNNNNNNTVTSKKHKKTALATLKYKRNKEEQQKSSDELRTADCSEHTTGTITNGKMKKTQRNFSLNLKQTLCNIFRFKKIGSPDQPISVKRGHGLEVPTQDDENIITDYEQNPGLLHNGSCTVDAADDENPRKLPFFKRALPPLPKTNGHVNIAVDTQGGAENSTAANGCNGSVGISPATSIQGLSQDGEERVSNEDTSMDFAASIEKVKDYGWYWGPISGEAAEKILSNEPDGSFIVRDSSDDHYIFSLSFRLNNCVRHVRIEHDQGNFSFGSCTKFKSHTIVDFIENAVEHSRSGRYLFFLHRRPVLGPMRVQLLHPVSRFKQVQSLQHTCRFVILKMVRKDLISTLPLPRRLIDYLSAPHYYSEQLACEQEERVESPVSSSTGELEKICFTPQGLSS